MDFVKKRLPCRADALLVFGWSVFLIHVWSILHILEILPSWAIRLDWFDVIGVAAYPLVFALLESIVIWLLLVLISFVLPEKFMRMRFVSQGAIFLLILAILSAWMQFYFGLVFEYRTIIPGVITGVFCLALFLSFMVGKSENIASFIRAALSRIGVLSGIYIFLDVMGLLVILMRNI